MASGPSPKPDLAVTARACRAAARLGAAMGRGAAADLNEELHECWESIAGADRVLDRWELRVVFERLGRRMTDREYDDAFRSPHVRGPHGRHRVDRNQLPLPLTR